ncbi:MAG: putative anti-sigma regulatory factor, serine/threonine protein kinase [Ignavibacteria bacterium]|nr:putative anti-sigma regulatory factor, serine/threonine protein kinase [Ignavibacteria bacterium]
MKNSTSKYGNKICTCCDFSELQRIREFVMTKAETLGFSSEEAQSIALAVDEACSNLIKHTFNFDTLKEICVQVNFDKNQFIVNILDEGTPFNPLDVTPQDMNEYFKNYKRGGLGIPIIRKIMDEISYLPSNNSNRKNVLTLKKFLH